MGNNETSFNQRLSLVEQAIDRYGSYIQHYLYGLTKQWQDAEGLADDLWVLVLNKFPEDKILHIGMLRRKAYQLFCDEWRKKQRNPFLAVEEVPDYPLPRTVEEALSEQEEQALKLRFFEEYRVDLEPLQKEALWLYARYGMTYKEIAAKLNKPASTIGDWITQSRKVFADYLNNN